MNIIHIVEDELTKHPGKRVQKVDLDIGRLAGIEMDAFEFLWDTSIKETVLGGAERNISFIEGIAECNSCGVQYKLDQLYDECPKCGSYDKLLLSGKEMRVSSITVI
jgi:hydrogenase nickel incorporation protein HypA/HybF